MKSARQFGALLLLLFLSFAPSERCAAAGAQLTQQELACCRMMKNQCGPMDMSAAHNCCRKSLQASHSAALQIRPVDISPNTTLAAHPTLATLTVRSWASREWAEAAEHAPPKSPPLSISVLRI